MATAKGYWEAQRPQLEAWYNRARFPHFVCHNGNWDIYADESGYCAAIVADGAPAGCLPSHFGNRAYVRQVLGV